MEVVGEGALGAWVSLQTRNAALHLSCPPTCWLTLTPPPNKFLIFSLHLLIIYSTNLPAFLLTTGVFVKTHATLQKCLSLYKLQAHVLFMSNDERKTELNWCLPNRPQNKKPNIIARVPWRPRLVILGVNIWIAEGTIADTAYIRVSFRSSSIKNQHLLKHTLRLKIAVQRSAGKVQFTRCRFKVPDGTMKAGLKIKKLCEKVRSIKEPASAPIWQLRPV